ncbi:MAG: hypothetical protein J6W89_01140 [Paludibacteraceae bacterium]|nr:hypothetical protein [Paludibacteraceae bacterium]
MKKVIFAVAVTLLMSSCGLTKSTTSSNAAAPQAATTTSAQTAVSAGQGAGNALLNLYNQYKADGKYDYQNMQNILNTVTLVANCEGLKSNYKDTEYLKDFGKGMIASSLGLVTQNNVETVTNSLVEMVKSSETVQEAKATTQSTASTAAGYANTAAQYAGALGTLLSSFASK